MLLGRQSPEYIQLFFIRCQSCPPSPLVGILFGRLKRETCKVIQDECLTSMGSWRTWPSYMRRLIDIDKTLMLGNRLKLLGLPDGGKWQRTIHQKKITSHICLECGRMMSYVAFSFEKSHSKLHIKLNISCRLSLWVQTAVEKNSVSQERKVQACLRVQRYWRGFRSALHSDRVTKGSDSDLVRSGNTKVWFVNLREAAMGIPVHNHVKVLLWRKYQKSPRFSEIGFSALS